MKKSARLIAQLAGIAVAFLFVFTISVLRGVYLVGTLSWHRK